MYLEKKTCIVIPFCDTWSPKHRDNWLKFIFGENNSRASNYGDLVKVTVNVDPTRSNRRMSGAFVRQEGPRYKGGPWGTKKKDPWAKWGIKRSRAHHLSLRPFKRRGRKREWSFRRWRMNCNQGWTRWRRQWKKTWEGRKKAKKEKPTGSKTDQDMMERMMKKLKTELQSQHVAEALKVNFTKQMAD